MTGANVILVLFQPVVKADADPDADGVSNWAEFKAGTNPTDNRSLLRLIQGAVRAVGALPLSWPTVLNKTYVWNVGITGSSRLDGLVSNIIGTGDDQELAIRAQ
jgi:hypothetical protein